MSPKESNIWIEVVSEGSVSKVRLLVNLALLELLWTFGVHYAHLHWIGHPAVYVDDIIILDNDQTGIETTKRHLKQHFTAKDLDWLRYLE